MQVEELGLFSGGKCNSAVEDKLALEVYSLFLKYNKEFHRCIETKDIKSLQINKDSFKAIEDEFKLSDLYYLLPKFTAITNLIPVYVYKRKFPDYDDTNFQSYIAIVGFIADYLKCLIFNCLTTYSNYKHYFIDDNLLEYQSLIDELFETELNKVTVIKTFL